MVKKLPSDNFQVFEPKRYGMKFIGSLYQNAFDNLILLKNKMFQLKSQHFMF